MNKMPNMTAEDKTALIAVHHMTAMFDRPGADFALLQTMGKALRDDAMTPEDAVDLIKAAFDEKGDAVINAMMEQDKAEPSEPSDIMGLLNLLSQL